MKTSISAVALASSLVACGNGAPPEQTSRTAPAMAPQRSQPSRLTAAVVNGPIDLGTLGGKFSWAEGINALGQVIGTADTGAGIGPGAFVLHAFLWQSGTGMTDLGMLPNAISSLPSAINDQGQIAGANLLATGDQRAVLWTIVRPLTPAEQIAALTDAVNKLAAAGKLNRGNAQSLLTKLDNAARQLTAHAHESVAAQMLGQFAQKVGDLVAGGTLSNSDGQPLIDAARKLINQLTT